MKPSLLASHPSLASFTMPVDNEQKGMIDQHEIAEIE